MSSWPGVCEIHRLAVTAALKRRIRVGILVGGASSEREISLASGKMIAEHLPRERYDVVMLDTLALMAHNPKLSAALRERAQRLLEHDHVPQMEGQHQRELPPAFLAEVQRAAEEALPATEAILAAGGGARIDVAFPALHGPFGEDGTIQGMLELLGIPYVGSGVLASALAMDKAMTKKVFAAEGIPTPAGLVVERSDFRRDAQAVVLRAQAVVPAVVKPVCQGSSIGMSLVTETDQMGPALEEAFAYDERVLVEERLVGTELTVAVIGNRELTALPIVEIVSKRDFFDYRAKYDPALSEELCPARVSPELASAAQELALRAHRALGCRGLSRVDMMSTSRGVVVLELNTMPGMTMNSLFPKAARAAGLSFGCLLDRLIRLALGDEA